MNYRVEISAEALDMLMKHVVFMAQQECGGETEGRIKKQGTVSFTDATSLPVA